jgi:hypothetical protein
MKISIAAAILILVVGAVIGRYDRQQLAALRTTAFHPMPNEAPSANDPSARLP